MLQSVAFLHLKSFLLHTHYVYDMYIEEAMNLIAHDLYADLYKIRIIILGEPVAKLGCSGSVPLRSLEKKQGVVILLGSMSHPSLYEFSRFSISCNMLALLVGLNPVGVNDLQYLSHFVWSTVVMWIKLPSLQQDQRFEFPQICQSRWW